MPRRTDSRPMTLRITPQLRALLPEISRLHAGRSAGDVMRRLLTQEAVRLGLLSAEAVKHVRGRRRAST